MSTDKPVISPSESLPEITVRAVLLGTILTIVLAAANAYLGLKVGLTVSASIPAAVISMGILRFFRQSNILENTMVQIMASVGEALTAGIAFILPALVALKIWHEFYYWQTVCIGLVGGGLGVLFTIPLRRALLQDKTLRYPEAVAIGNVLKANAQREKGDLGSLVSGGFVGAVIALFQTGFQVLEDHLQCWFKSSSMVFGFGMGFSPALIAAGYIVGVNVALSLLVGILIGWVFGVPVLTYIYGLPEADTANLMAIQIWSHQIRYIGVGTMLVGSLWTLLTLFKPLIDSVMASFKQLRQIRLGLAAETLRTERDIPIHYVLIGIVVLLIPIFLYIACWLIPDNFGLAPDLRVFIAECCTAFILFGGFLFCMVIAYFAGLIGSTNSPVSGLLVCALLLVSLMLIAILNGQVDISSETKSALGIMVAIGSMVILGAALSISNDTMQDLRVGQIVGATPWKQQVMLILGVIVASLTVPLILQLLYNAYGIAGVFPRADMNPEQMLAAPQAGLMASVATGVFTHQLEWNLIIAGGVIAIVCLVLDKIIHKWYGVGLPVLAVGVGIYLPLDSSVPVVIGGMLSYVTLQRLNTLYLHGKIKGEALLNTHRHRGLLLSCGLVAGASVMGVVLAIPFAWKQSADVLRIVPASFAPMASALSVIVTITLCWWMYHRVVRK